VLLGMGGSFVRMPLWAMWLTSVVLAVGVASL
jgi:hypothetical protein